MSDLDLPPPLSGDPPAAITDESTPSVAVLRRISRNFSLLSVAEVVKIACNAAATLYLARRLGAAAFGVFGFALAVQSYLLAVVDGGFTLLGTRDVARDVRRAPSHVETIVIVRLLLACAATVLLFVFASAIDVTPVARRVLLLSGLSLWTAALSLDWVFYGLEQVRGLGAASIVRAAVFLGGVVLVVHEPGDIWRAPLVQAASEAVGVGVLATGYARRFGVRWVRPDWSTLAAEWRQAIPIGAGQLLRAVTYQFSVVLIALRLDEGAVGRFVGAQKLVLALLGFSPLYFYTYLPLISTRLKRDPAAAGGVLSDSIRATTAVTLPMAIGGTLLSGPIVMTVYGPDYADSAAIFRLLVWVLPVIILAGHFRQTLIAADMQRRDLACVASAAAVSVACNLVFVPIMGVLGAALAMLASESALVVLSYISVRRVVQPSVARHVTAPALAGAVMALALWGARRAGVLVAIPLGALVYFGLLWILRRSGLTR